MTQSSEGENAKEKRPRNLFWRFFPIGVIFLLLLFALTSAVAYRHGKNHSEGLDCHDPVATTRWTRGLRDIERTRTLAGCRLSSEEAEKIVSHLFANDTATPELANELQFFEPSSVVQALLDVLKLLPEAQRTTLEPIVLRLIEPILLKIADKLLQRLDCKSDCATGNTVTSPPQTPTTPPPQPPPDCKCGCDDPAPRQCRIDAHGAGS